MTHLADPEKLRKLAIDCETCASCGRTYVREDDDACSSPADGGGG